MAETTIPKFHVPETNEFVATCEQLVPVLENIATHLALAVSNSAGHVDDDDNRWRQRRQLIRAAMDTLTAVDDAARVLTALSQTVDAWHPWVHADAHSPVPDEVMDKAGDKFSDQFLPAFTALITGHRPRVIRPKSWNLKDVPA